MPRPDDHPVPSPDSSHLADAGPGLDNTTAGSKSSSPFGPGDEVVEHIPWDRLTVATHLRPAWLPYALGTLAVAIVAAGILSFRATPSEPTVITLPPEPARSGPGEQFEGEEGGAVQPPTTAEEVAAPGQIVTEADLMAFVPPAGEAAAAARAEWFVLDYFSSSDSGRVEKLTTALPNGIEVPEPASGRMTYVDWVRALSTEPGRGGSYVVTVLYRTLVASDGQPYRAGPVRAVKVSVAVAPDGSGSVLDLPAPAELPTGAVPVTPVQWQPAEAPGPVLEQLWDELPGAGEDPRIVGASTDGMRWRIVVEWGDDATGRWPHAVIVDTVRSPQPAADAQSGK